MIDDDVIRLLCDSFGDDKKYIKSLILSGFLDGNGLYAEYFDRKPVSVLFVKQFPVNIGNEKCFADYFYYVATDKNYRGQGISSSLIKKTLEKLSAGNSRLAVLIPASESLFGFYSKLGFETDFYVSRNIYPVNEFETEPTEITEIDSCKAKLLYKLYEKKYKSHSDCLYKSESVFSQICDEYAFCDDEKILFNGNDIAFASFGKSIKIRDFTGDDEKTFSAAVCKKYGLPVTAESFPTNKDFPIGMAYWYKERPNNVNPMYMNNILN